MSSTNRGGERSQDDFYATPSWVTDALLQRIGPLAGKRILEPSAGDGAIVRRLLVAGATNIVAIDVDRDRCNAISDSPEVQTRMAERRPYVINTRFEAWAHDAQRFDFVIMNPPFGDALEHVERAISLLATGGLCAALLRLGFGLTQKRAPFRARHPFDKLELARRPSFTNGGNDSTDYGWFLFGTRQDGTTCGGRFEVIEEGPQ